MSGKDSDNPEQAWPSEKYAWYVAIFLMLTFVVATIDRMLIVVLVEPIKADFGFSDTQIGFIQGISFGVFYTVLSLPVGYLIDNYKRTRILAFCIGVWSLFTAAGGLATSFLQLVLARIGVAVGESAIGPGTISLLSDYFPKDKLSRAFGLVVAGQTIGNSLALVLGGSIVAALSKSPDFSWPLVGSLEPWRVTFVLAAFPGAILIILLLLTVREPLRRKSKAETKDTSLSGNAVKHLMTFLRREWRLLIPLFLATALFGLVSQSFIVWMPTFFLRTYDWDLAQTGQALGLVTFVAGISGSLLVGYVEAWGRKLGFKDASICVVLIAATAFAVAMVIGPLASSGEVALLILGIGIFFGIWPIILVPTILAEISPSNLRAQTFAVYFIVLGVIGIGGGPVLVGFFTDYIFRDEGALRLSLSVVCGLLSPISIGLYLLALRQYNRYLRRIENRP